MVPWTKYESRSMKFIKQFFLFQSFIWAEYAPPKHHEIKLSSFFIFFFLYFKTYLIDVGGLLKELEGYKHYVCTLDCLLSHANLSENILQDNFPGWAHEQRKCVAFTSYVHSQARGIL